MSRTYLQHSELFPEPMFKRLAMRASDPYYMDHLRDSRVIIIQPKCAICDNTGHTTEWHHMQLMKDLQREK